MKPPSSVAIALLFPLGETSMPHGSAEESLISIFPNLEALYVHTGAGVVDVTGLVNVLDEPPEDELPDDEPGVVSEEGPWVEDGLGVVLLVGQNKTPTTMEATTARSPTMMTMMAVVSPINHMKHFWFRYISAKPNIT